MTEREELDRLWARHAALGHAIQSGVALTLARRGEEPQKYLRTGINIALSDQGALGRLLIAKGVLTERELVTALIEGLEAEVKSYEAELSQGGPKVTLG